VNTLGKSLNCSVPWYQLLSLMRLPVPNGNLPAVTSCPLCEGERLHIFQDTIFGGAWHCCSDCRAHGDMIHLAAHTWKKSLLDTAIYLEENGFTFDTDDTLPEAVSVYHKNIIGRFDRMSAMAVQAGVDLGNPHLSVMPILEKLGLHEIVNNRIWSERMREFVGAAWVVKVAQTIRPSVKKQEDLGWFRLGEQSPFKGKRWRDAVVIPVWDLPERVSGFLVIGNQASTADHVFVPLSRNESGRDKQETGICMYPIVDRQTAYADQFGNTLFVVPDVVAAVRLQAEHLRDSGLPLPLVGAHSDYTVTKRGYTRNWAAYGTWKSIIGKKFVFWIDQINASAFVMASEAGGKIYVGSKPDSFLRRSTREWLHEINKRAVPWITALDMTMEMLPEEQSVDLLKQFNRYSSHSEEFMRGCSQNTKELLVKMLDSGSSLKVAYAKNRTVRETERGWFDDKSAICITDAILRITEAYYQKSSERTFYKGVIIYNGEEVPFMDEAGRIEQGTGAWLRNQLIATKKGIPHVDRAWNTHLYDLAIQFHSPDVRHGLGGLGWRPDTSSFVLPHFHIRTDGSILEQEEPVVERHAPGRQLQPPGLQSPDFSRLLVNNEINRVFWAVTACVTANVITPAINRQLVSIGLIGSGASAIGRLTAVSLGCGEYKYSNYGSQAKDVAGIQDAITEHNWPVLMTTKNVNKRKLFPWFNAQGDRNVIMVIDDMLSDAIGLQSAWRFVSNADSLTTATAIVDEAPKLLPEWLVDFCKRDRELQAEDTTLALQVLQDFTHWIAKKQGDTAVLEAATSLIDDTDGSPEEQASRFVSFIYRMISDGDVSYIRTSYGKAGAGDAVLQIDDMGHVPGVFVSCRIFNKCLSRKGLPWPDPDKVYASLEDAGALEPITEYNGEKGWLLREAWWESQISLCSLYQSKLKIVR
jgi:hypothetical protein